MTNFRAMTFVCLGKQFHRKAVFSKAAQVALATLLIIAMLGNASAQQLGSVFNYQGQLTESNQPATGLYDLQICLFDSMANPVPLGCAPDLPDVPVDAGLFTVALEFGSGPFSGQQRFLELRVRPGASTGGYTILAPRQLIRPAPEALRANAAGVAPWTGLTGVPSGFADGIDNIGGVGSVTSVTAGTGLSGGIITGSGTIGIASGGVGSVEIADGGVAAVDIAAESLGAAQIASNAIAAAELADAAVDTNAVQNLAITQGKIAAAAVGSAQIDSTQVQRRVNGSCFLGSYLRGLNADGSVLCSDLPGEGVSTVVTLDSGDAVGTSQTSMAIGADGRPVISYSDSTNGNLKVVRCTTAACQSSSRVTVDNSSNDVGSFSAIAIGADGLPIMSYYDTTAGNLKVAKCTIASCSTATISTVDASASDVGKWSAIAIGADGRAVISYYNATSGSLKVAKCGSAACDGLLVITTLDNPSNSVGEFTDIAIGNDGLPVISYYDATAGSLKVAKCANTTCSAAASITTVNPDGGQFSSIAIAPDGLPIISSTSSINGRLTVAKCANAACTGSATITNFLGGFNSSIAIGSDALAVIAFYNFTPNTAKVAKCADAACTSLSSIAAIFQESADDGYATSIAIGRDGFPAISYVNLTLRNLKFAKCDTRSCE